MIDIIKEEDKLEVENTIKNTNENINKSTNNEQMPTGWSWAGSFATTVTFIGAGKLGLAILYIVLTIIPIVNIITIIGFFVYGGLKGKEIIYTADKYLNHDEKMGAIKTLESAGYFFFIMFMIIVAIFFTLFVFSISISSFY